jgi:peptidoglycan/LPS O-acetylase OafA/YrhL
VQVAVWAVLGRPVSVEGVLINATLYAFPVNGVTWTLNVEMVAVAFVLAVYLGWRTAGVAGMALAVAASWVLLQIPNLPLALTFKGFWVYFALGILIPTRVGRLISELVPSVAIVPILLMVIVFKSTLQQIAIALLVTMIFYNRAGSFGRLLETPAAQFLGRISYSFYLYNFMVFVLICEHVKKWKITVEHPLEVGLVASIATVAATIPLAYLSVWLVENPAIRLGRALTTDRSRMRSRAAAVRS